MNTAAGSVGESIKSQQIEEALRVSEEKYRTLVDHLSDGVFIIQDEHIQFFNAAFAKLAGYDMQEIVGKPFEDFIAPGYRDLVMQRYHERQQGKDVPKGYEIQLFRKDKTTLDVMINVGIITYNGRVASMGVVRDISERKKAEKSIKESEQFLRQIIDLVPHFIFAKDIESRFLLVNKAVADAYGTTSIDIVGKSDIDFSATPEQARHFHEDDLAVIRGKTAKFIPEEPIKDATGGVRYLQTSKIPFEFGETKEQGILGVSVDITKEKQLREKITEDKSKNEAILESIGDAVFACDKDGVILLFNTMAEKLTGVARKDAIGQKYNAVLTFVKEIDGSPSEDFIGAAIRTNTITKMTNHTVLVKRDGGKVPVSDSAAPVKNVHGDIIGCVVAFHDVTKEREIDKAKTEFVSLASHQLRTPLTTINWYSEALLSPESISTLSQKQQEYLKETNNASRRMVNLIDALLNVSRLEMGTFPVEPEAVNVEDLAKICIRELYPMMAAKRIELHESYDSAISVIQVDRKLLGLVFTNLLTNAVKYSPIGGAVDLQIQKEKDDMVITVKDVGIGIPKEQQDKIFTKLFRADNAKKVDPDGTGLGLYIVRSITVNSGGTIWFESQGGGMVSDKESGSVFHVRLPLSGMNTQIASKM